MNAALRRGNQWKSLAALRRCETFPAGPMSTNVPPELRYAKSHEWVRTEGDSATVGITDHAQHELTDIVFVELPAPGRQLKAGEACAVVESVKTASDVYSPLSGQVVAANQAVIDNPALVNSDPYGAGWFYRLRLDQPSELATLLAAEAYLELIGPS
jgi:glycine cleavage system H protein